MLFKWRNRRPKAESPERAETSSGVNIRVVGVGGGGGVGVFRDA